MNKIKNIVFLLIDKIFALLPEEGSGKWGIDRRIIKSFISDIGRACIAVIIAGLISLVELIQIPVDAWYYGIALAGLAMVIRFLGKLKNDYSDKK